jgi:hypothetical protein
MLRTYCDGNIHRWDDFVDTALFSTRVRTHRVTGKSPFYLTYGREPVLPGDPFIPFIDKQFTKDPVVIAERNAEDLAKLGQVRASIEWKTKSVSAADKKRWDAKIKPLTLEIGDHVRMRKESKLGLEPNWLGPYVVVGRNLETLIYKLEHVLGEPYNSWVHVGRLRKIDPYSVDTPFYSPATTRANWLAENGLPPDEPHLPDTSMHPVPVPDPNMEDDIVDPSEVDRGRSTNWEGGIVADASSEEPTTVPRPSDQDIPLVERSSKTLGGVDKWRFAPTVPKVRRSNTLRDTTAGQSDEVRQPPT